MSEVVEKIKNDIAIASSKRHEFAKKLDTIIQLLTALENALKSFKQLIFDTDWNDVVILKPYLNSR